MTIEKDLSRIATALETIANHLTAGNVNPTPAPTSVATAPAPAPIATAPAPAPVVAAPVPTPAPVPVAPPAAPVIPAPTAGACPFNDPKGLIQYIMDSYRALGPTKGANIQTVLVNLGYQNINEVKPEHYAAVHAGVEALKA